MVKAVTRDQWEIRGKSRITEAQRRILNAICGDLAKHIRWHGNSLDKDDFRHLLSAVAAGQTLLPGWQYGDGRAQGFIMLGKSSLDLTKSEACDAITAGLHLGDHPDEQGIKARPVSWSDAVLRGTGWNPDDLK